MNRAEFLQWLGTLMGAGVVRPNHGKTTARASHAESIPERRLGRTGVHLPMLGLGGFHFGSAGSERAARTLLETALSEGIRFLDNAESYHDGTSER